MEIALSPNQEKKFCLADGYENYLTLGSDRPENSEGLVYKNQILAADFCVFADAGGYKKLWTRFEDASERLGAGFFSADFCEGKFSVICSLLENALYFDCKNFDKKSASLAVLLSIDLAKKLDKGQAFAASVPVEIARPLASELLQLTKVFGKKASHARVISFERPGRIYISLDHSPSASTKAAARLLAQDAFALHAEEIQGSLAKSAIDAGGGVYGRALFWAKFSSLQFLNKNKTQSLWAGLPWFRDYWGRDIFLSVPGALLFTGNIQEAQTLLERAAELQDANPRSVTYGRLPNIYRGSGDIVYNTADATLLFVREVYESARFSGDEAFLARLWPAVRLALECDRTLRTDSAGFLLHGDADTWMDARIFGEKSFCPRGNRACDIQALWFTALLCGARIAARLKKDEEQKAWEEEAQKVKSAFLGTFFDGQKMADCVLRDGERDFRVRPNQLALAVIPKILEERFIPQDAEEKIVRNAVSELLFPYGLCSLSQNDPYFHPYHKTWEWHHEDAAYHNGAIWTWTAGTAIGALCDIGAQDMAWAFAKKVAAQFFDGPCAGTLPANLWAYPDEEGRLHFSGAYSSCRSDAEFHRAAWEYFLGLQVDLLEKTIRLRPRLPSEWKAGSAEIRLGLKNDLLLRVLWSEEKSGGREWRLSAEIIGGGKAADGAGKAFEKARAAKKEFAGEKPGEALNAEKAFAKAGADFKSERAARKPAPLTAAVFFDGTEEVLDLSGGEKKCFGKIFFAENPPDFARPRCLDPDWKKPECLLQKNFLAEIALRQEFNPGHPPSLTAIRN